ncbi:MAG: hypothetical protein AAF493_21680, partial [Pseudomonadota bacterium]
MPAGVQYHSLYLIRRHLIVGLTLIIWIAASGSRADTPAPESSFLQDVGDGKFTFAMLDSTTRYRIEDCERRREKVPEAPNDCEQRYAPADDSGRVFPKS